MQASGHRGQAVLEYCLVAAVLLLGTLVFWRQIDTEVRRAFERGLQRAIQAMVPAHTN